MVGQALSGTKTDASRRIAAAWRRRGTCPPALRSWSEGNTPLPIHSFALQREGRPGRGRIVVLRHTRTARCARSLSHPPLRFAKERTRLVRRCVPERQKRGDEFASVAAQPHHRESRRQKL